MKTSLYIDDHLYQAARLAATQEHTTVRALVERGLRQVLGLAEPAPDIEAARRERAALEDLCQQISALPLLDVRSPDEILGYDQSGGFS